MGFAHLNRRSLERGYFNASMSRFDSASIIPCKLCTYPSGLYIFSSTPATTPSSGFADSTGGRIVRCAQAVRSAYCASFNNARAIAIRCFSSPPQSSALRTRLSGEQNIFPNYFGKPMQSISVRSQCSVSRLKYISRSYAPSQKIRLKDNISLF